MRIRFDGCTLDSETRELLRSGKAVHLHPKAFRLLELLIENRPRAVSKEELHERLWPKTFVSEANLASLVAEIRRGIGEKGRSARAVRTVHGFGYAFSAEGVEDRPPARGRPRYSLAWGRKEIPLAGGENVVGRDRTAGVHIDDPSISRRHARITVSGDRALIEDLGSKNGTFVEGRKVEKPSVLSDGDEIQLGTLVLTFRALSPDRSTETARKRKG